MVLKVEGDGSAETVSKAGLTITTPVSSSTSHGQWPP